jgi:hypothetical protein
LLLRIVNSFVFSSIWTSPDYTPTARKIAGNRGVISGLLDAGLAAQEPSPMAGAAEGV